MGWKQSPSAALLGLLTLHLLAHVDRNMLLGFAPQMVRDLALSNAQYGVLVGAVWVLSFGAMAMLAGWLADRYSRTRLIAVGVLIWSACTWASGRAASFEQLVLARLFVACGEAALVPAATSLLAELFSPARRGTACGIFFIGIPMGIGCSFLLAGGLGATYGWRDTFSLLGWTGAVLGLPLLLLPDRRSAAPGAAPSLPFGRQMRELGALLARRAALRQAIAGFVLVHLAFVSLAFTTLWLARERGMEGPPIATRIGLLQLGCGIAGSLLGGMAGDRMARRLPGGMAGFAALLVLLCAPLMAASRLAAPGSVLMYAGLCAGFFLPLALYGPSLSLLTGLTPAGMHATITGFAMLVINVFAIALGNLCAGAAIDAMTSAGLPSPMTSVLLALDILVAAAALCYGRVACHPHPTLIQPATGVCNE